MDFFTQRFYDRSYATASMRSFLEIEKKKQWHTCSLVHTKGGANRDTGLLFFLCLSSLSGQLVSRTMRRKRDQMVDQSRSAKLKNLPLKQCIVGYKQVFAHNILLRTVACASQQEWATLLESTILNFITLQLRVLVFNHTTSCLSNCHWRCQLLLTKWTFNLLKLLVRLTTITSSARSRRR